MAQFGSWKKSFQTEIKLIIGLGNPGKEYSRSRHNIGHEIIDYVSNSLNIRLNTNKFNGFYFKGRIDDVNFIIAKPQTYMNNSWMFIHDISLFYKIRPENVLIIYDDKDINLGDFKIRSSGGHGNHRGVANIINYFKTKEIKRIRVGINSPTSDISLRDFVLHKFSSSEWIVVQNLIRKMPDIIYDFLHLKFENLMNKYNKNE